MSTQMADGQQTAAATTLKLLGDREVEITRTFNAPRALVYKAHTDPLAIPQWWGPKGVTTTVDKMDVRPGGVWRFISRGEDGEFAFNGVYREVSPVERLSYTFEFEPIPGHIMVETLTFEDLDGKTKLTMLAHFETVADRDGMVNSGMEHGQRDSYERLDDYLARNQ
jgi:uncharacterized protein YndB with AHSA1/START domain